MKITTDLTEEDYSETLKEQIKEIKYDLLDYCEKEKHLRYDDQYIWYEVGTNGLKTNMIKIYCFRYLCV